MVTLYSYKWENCNHIHMIPKIPTKSLKSFNKTKHKEQKIHPLWVYPFCHKKWKQIFLISNPHHNRLPFSICFYCKAWPFKRSYNLEWNDSPLSNLWSSILLSPIFKKLTKIYRKHMIYHLISNLFFPYPISPQLSLISLLILSFNPTKTSPILLLSPISTLFYYAFWKNNI